MSDDGIVFRRFIAGMTRVALSDLISVRVERMRNPFMWRTIVWFTGKEGDEERRLGFVPFHREAFVLALRRLGVRVEGASAG